MKEVELIALIGIDIGTSGVKVIVINCLTKFLQQLQKNIQQVIRILLWSEQNPEDWWIYACKAIEIALHQSNINVSDIRGVGITGQMVGLVTLDKQFNVIRPCMLWNDQRSVQQALELTTIIGKDKIMHETNNPIFASFIAPKIKWMERYEANNYAKIRYILMPKDYIIYKLTGIISTDVMDVSGTCYFNVSERKWSKTMIKAIGIPQKWLPKYSESDEIIGSVTLLAVRKTGISEGTPVVAGAGDQPAQSLGMGIVKSGLSSITIGTSGVIFTQCDTPVENRNELIHSFCHCIPDQWYLMGVMLSAGGSFQWVHNIIDALMSIEYKLMDEMAEKIKLGCDGLIFLPYLAGERCPYNDPYARGGWIGLNQRHGIEHLIKSVMEGISFGLYDLLTLIHNMGIDIKSIYASGGAIKSETWLQMMADIFNIEIKTINLVECAALGAAMIAGIGVGVFNNASDAADKLIHVTSAYIPREEEPKVYMKTYKIYHGLYSSLKNTFFQLSQLEQ